MGTLVFYDETHLTLEIENPNKRQPLERQLEIVEINGNIVIRIGEVGEVDSSNRSTCILSISEAKKFLESLEGAISRIAY